MSHDEASEEEDIRVIRHKQYEWAETEEQEDVPMDERAVTLAEREAEE
ncbi:hypothetical protein KIPB_014772, partial [Kipferlia bialata]|eukprot:g14772.t1